VAQTVPDSIADDLPERNLLLDLAKKIPPETLQLYYQIALLGRRDISLAPDEFAGFTMSLLRMLAFTPNNETPAQKASIKLASTLKPQLAIAPTPASNPIRQAVNTDATEASVSSKISIPTNNTGVNPNRFNGNWRGLVDELKLGLARALAQHCELVAYDEQSISLSVPETQKHLLLPNYQEKLSSAISQYFNQKIELKFSIGGTGNTPAQQISQEKAHAQANAENAIENDPFVQVLINDFSAAIIPNSIKPI
jgi:DNA polymerase-3 subunit gamma/tau